MKKYIDGYDALQQMCSGYSSNQIAYHLIEKDGIWAGKELEKAATRVRACLSKAKEQYFHFAEIIAISRFTSNFSAVEFMCSEIGLSQPYQLSVEEQIAGLRTSIDSASKTIESAITTLDKMNNQKNEYSRSPGNLRAVNFYKENCKEASK